MIQVQGKNHSWIVYSITGDPITDEQIEEAVSKINETPVKAYILGGYFDTETSFEKIDALLSPIREVGMTPGDLGVLIDIGKSQIILLPVDDLEDNNEGAN